MNKAELKSKLINLSNKMKQSDGELLDLLLENASEGTLLDTITALELNEMQYKLMSFFEAKDGIFAEQYENDYPDEWRITLKYGGEMHIELANREKAVNNELDFINSIDERNEFLKDIAEEYIKFIKNINLNQKSTSKIFYIIISNEKIQNNNLEIVKEELNEQFLKIKECLSRCGNYVEKINSKEELFQIIYSFYNTKKYLKNK